VGVNRLAASAGRFSLRWLHARGGEPGRLRAVATDEHVGSTHVGVNRRH